MKRFLCILLSFVMLLSLSACGDKDVDVSPTDEPVIEDATSGPEQTVPEDIPDETEPEVTDYYELKDGLNPVLGPVVIEELEYKNEDGSKDIVKISTTPLAFDVDNIIFNLEANPFVSEKYSGLYSYAKEANTPKTQDGIVYNLLWDYNYITNGADDAYNYFEIMTVQFRDYYTNPISVTTTMSMKVDDLNQEDILSALKIIYPSEIADYLVYGKDLDGVDNDGAELGGEYYMEDAVVVGDATYEVERRVILIDDCLSLTYVVGVSANAAWDYTQHVFPNEAQLYQVSDYTPENTFSDNMPELSPFNYEEFASEFFKGLNIDFQNVGLDSWTFMDYVDNNNIRYTNFVMQFTVYDSNNERETDIACSIRATIDGDVIAHHEIVLESWTADLLAEDVKSHTELFVDRYNNVIDGVEIGEVVVDAEYDNNCSATATCVINGLTYEGSLSTHYANTPMMSLTLEYWGFETE